MFILLALFFIVYGLFAFFSPKGAFAFKANLAKSFGVKMIPGKKTYKMVKYMGIVLIVIGVLMLIS